MPFRPTLLFDIVGPVDQPTLDHLRASLRLAPRGLLSDGRDEHVGMRVTVAHAARLKLLLFSKADRDGWLLDLFVDGVVATASVRVVEAEVRHAVAARGLGLKGVFRT